MHVLEGLKVVDLTQSVSGPTATLLLAFLGAEVIKVEGPQGDAARGWGPPFVGELGSMFISFNRGKGAVTLDLSTEEGRSQLQELVGDADVFIQNFRDSTARKLGIDFESISAMKPDIVYCAITGFGGLGPRANEPGYDAMMQAFSGIMHLTGEPDGEPSRTGPGVLDIGAGMLATIGIVSALVQRAEGRPGPWNVETSLIETAAFFLTDRITSYLITGEEPYRMGSAREGMAPYENFRASEGYVLIAAGTERFWKELCKALDLEELLDDPRFESNRRRMDNRHELKQLIEARTRTYEAEDLVSLLQSRSIPCAKVNKLSEFLADPQIAALSLIEMIESPVGELKSVARPFRLNGLRLPLSSPPLRST